MSRRRRTRDKQVIRNARWRAAKREMKARGWVEVAPNTLVPPGLADIYPVWNGSYERPEFSHEPPQFRDRV